MKKDSKKRTIIEVSSDVILGCAIAPTCRSLINNTLMALLKNVCQSRLNFSETP
jgi:large-conductance mechanosensitive channel